MASEPSSNDTSNRDDNLWVKKPWAPPVIQQIFLNETHSTGPNMFEDQVGGGVAS